MLRSFLFLFLFGSAVGQRSSGYGDRQTAKLSNNKEDGEQISLGAGPSNGALTIEGEFYNIRENLCIQESDWSIVLLQVYNSAVFT